MTAILIILFASLVCMGVHLFLYWLLGKEKYIKEIRKKPQVSIFLSVIVGFPIIYFFLA